MQALVEHNLRVISSHLFTFLLPFKCFFLSHVLYKFATATLAQVHKVLGFTVLSMYLYRIFVWCCRVLRFQTNRRHMRLESVSVIIRDIPLPCKLFASYSTIPETY